jgi:hypothetical protein
MEIKIIDTLGGSQVACGSCITDLVEMGYHITYSAATDSYSLIYVHPDLLDEVGATLGYEPSLVLEVVDTIDVTDHDGSMSIVRVESEKELIQSQDTESDF